MKHSKHTPGPWAVFGHQSAGISVAGECGETVARVANVELPDTEVRANARLIAAAPELVEALRLVTECVALNTGGGARFFIAYPQRSNGDVDFDAVVRTARELIAKATGGDE